MQSACSSPLQMPAVVQGRHAAATGGRLRGVSAGASPCGCMAAAEAAAGGGGDAPVCELRLRAVSWLSRSRRTGGCSDTQPCCPGAVGARVCTRSDSVAALHRPRLRDARWCSFGRTQSSCWKKRLFKTAARHPSRLPACRRRAQPRCCKRRGVRAARAQRGGRARERVVSCIAVRNRGSRHACFLVASPARLPLTRPRRAAVPRRRCVCSRHRRRRAWRCARARTTWECGQPFAFVAGLRHRHAERHLATSSLRHVVVSGCARALLHLLRARRGQLRRARVRGCCRSGRRALPRGPVPWRGLLWRGRARERSLLLTRIPDLPALRC
jgi:hypothetical protein